MPRSRRSFTLDAPRKDRADDELEVVVEIEPGRVRSELLPARRIDEHRWELSARRFSPMTLRSVTSWKPTCH
jgi:hypothetical protein